MFSTDRPDLPAALIDTGIVAIMRAADTASVEAAVGVLIDAGVSCVELTLTMPDAVRSIEALVKRFGTA
jgi:2-dehydro-3-deoxyphosphogluconate aldolase/(4S)-4-hydroxy-2-oxoglutarate aldolase